MAMKGVDYMAQVNIRMDDELKARADMLFDELGMNMSTAVNMFVKQALREGGMPFSITTKVEPFWSEANQAHLRRVIADFESGNAKTVTKTMAELEAMEND